MDGEFPQFSSFDEAQDKQSQPIQPSIEPNQTKKSYWKFVIAFLIIIVLAAGGFFIYNKYFSAAAQQEKQNQENLQKYMAWQKNYEAAMKADTYGGKTPEETLQVFIDALKKGDVELASKYFMLDENGNENAEVIANLNNAKNEQTLATIINVASNAKFDKISSSDNTKWFVVKKSDGTVEHSIILKLNTYSNVWKIESM